MWQPVTDHELAWEYFEAGLLWYGDGVDDMYPYHSNWYEKGEFLAMCYTMGTEQGFAQPNYICIEG